MLEGKTYFGKYSMKGGNGDNLLRILYLHKLCPGIRFLFQSIPTTDTCA